MLIRTPRNPAHRFARESFYTIASPLRKIYWRLTHPVTSGVRAVVLSGEKILLVRIGYSHRLWTLPGGAVDRNESNEHAAIRELREESGVQLSEMTYLDSHFSHYEYKQDTVYYFSGKSKEGDLVIDGQEIIDAGWFEISNLPQQRNTCVDRGLAMYDMHYGKT